ncbi:MAG: DUF2277 domain-containing protein [Chloroflexi bacterium]|nr:MAG: DUF2277 domain-containing protein [Chloroflexota bacterium]TMB80347.1 MAG: DUF2277 domain-containing protein [Chloroflexota bacterium]TMB95729.1 MAG: DUF2277 domain-containing protein [Chloroflexota bacterium]TMC28893.1 MAG: DUF2277 domain-containing protein [Chloroflexota bacterium]TMC34374.1 MAG: DUF2277 domain-containing protein [Chloroflexota bacterium]
MCRSIRTLRSPMPATDEEIRAAALQFVRKVSGFRSPAPRNAEAFDAAVAEVAATTDRLLQRLPPSKARSDRPQPGPRRHQNGVGRTTPR